MRYHSVTVRREIRAPAEKVFDAWLRPESLAAWMACDAPAEARVDARKGGRFEVVDRHRTVFAGVFHDIQRPHRIVFSWLEPATRETRAAVSVEFHARNRSTEVVVVTSSIRGQCRNYSRAKTATLS